MGHHLVASHYECACGEIFKGLPAYCKHHEDVVASQRQVVTDDKGGAVGLAVTKTYEAAGDPDAV